jgi:hypothetical protein
MSSLTPRRRHRPSVRNRLRSVARYDEADFVHNIGTRPPQLCSLRGYLCVHLRYDLTFRVASFQTTLSSRLAYYRFQSYTDSSLRGFRVLPRSGLGETAVSPHPNRLGTALLGTHLSNSNLFLCLSSRKSFYLNITILTTFFFKSSILGKTLLS